MPGSEQAWTWLVAHLQALLPQDWSGTAGELFREGTQAASQFAKRNGLRPDELLDEGIDLGRRKLTGVATKEHAEAEKNYAEAAKSFTDTEDKKIEMELKRRVLESDIRKREAEARKAIADADLAEIQVAKAKLELLAAQEVWGCRVIIRFITRVCNHLRRQRKRRRITLVR